MLIRVLKCDELRVGHNGKGSYDTLQALFHGLRCVVSISMPDVAVPLVTFLMATSQIAAWAVRPLGSAPIHVLAATLVKGSHTSSHTRWVLIVRAVCKRGGL